MITADDLKAKARSRLNGVLRRMVAGEDPFPVAIGFERPKNTGDPSVIVKLKELLRSQSKETLGHGLTVSFESANTRRFGHGELPGEVAFASLDDLTVYVGRKGWADRVMTNAVALMTLLPEAREWAASHIDKLGEGDRERWTGIAEVVAYLRQHPLPGVYPRQLPVPVHTKFVEDNYAIIISVLAQIAPQSLDPVAKDWKTRLGLVDTPALVEGRFLDAAIAPHLPRHFLASMEDWAHCDLGQPRIVLVIENRTNFLALPPLAGVLAFLGMGYAVTRLARLNVLAQAKVAYWGDIDAHGFEILARLRAAVSQTESVMMDSTTLAAYTASVGDGNTTMMDEAEIVRSRLTAPETEVFNYCASHNKRLEQERLHQSFVEQCLAAL